VAAIAVAALSGVAYAATAPSPARYRAELNAMCRSTTVKLHAIEAELATARKAGDAQAYALALGEYLGLGLRENATIEAAPVPAALRPVMAPVLSILKRIDSRVRALLTSVAAGNSKALQADIAQVAALSGPAAATWTQPGCATAARTRTDPSPPASEARLARQGGVLRLEPAQLDHVPAHYRPSVS
jgi:hypothetical protein